MNPKDIRVTYNPPTHWEHLLPDGFLPRLPESHALWQFIKQANIMLEKIPEQVTLVGQEDTTVSLRSVAESVRAMYGIESLELMFRPRLLVAAMTEVRRCKLPMNVKLTRWFDSGGQLFDIVTRDPNALHRQ